MGGRAGGGKRKKQVSRRLADSQPEMTNSRDSKHGTKPVEDRPGTGKGQEARGVWGSPNPRLQRDAPCVTHEAWRARVPWRPAVSSLVQASAFACTTVPQSFFFF